MNFLTLFSSYITKTTIVAKALFSKKGIIIFTPVFISLPILSQLQESLWLLFWLMVVDFFTGIIASWFEKNKAEKTNPELKKENLISSEKLKKSGFKTLLYICSILAVFHVQKTFQLKTFQLSFSELNLSPGMVIIFFWCMVEFYSIVFENFKKMGFDVMEKIGNIIGVFKTTKSKIEE
jgi:phage-related holin